MSDKVALKIGDGAEVTDVDVLAVSRYRRSGLEVVLRLGDWQITRRLLLSRRLSADAWVMRDGERFQLTDDAAQMIADSLNEVRPWEGGW